MCDEQVRNRIVFQWATQNTDDSFRRSRHSPSHNKHSFGIDASKEDEYELYMPGKKATQEKILIPDNKPLNFIRKIRQDVCGLLLLFYSICSDIFDSYESRMYWF